MARDPNIILDILNKRSMNGCTINDMFHFLYNKELYRKAPHFTKITDPDSKIDDLVEKMRKEQYKWKVDPTVDTVLQQVLYMLIYSVYEPYNFTDSNHWSRVGRSVNTALERVYQHGRSSSYFIIYNLTDLLDNMDSKLLLSTVHEVVADNRIKELLRKKLKYAPISLTYGKTYSNTPIGSSLDCLLCNIYLTPLDRYIESVSGSSTLTTKTYTRYGNQCIITIDDKHRYSSFKEALSVVDSINKWIEDHYGVAIKEGHYNLIVPNKKRPIEFLGYNLQMIESKRLNNSKATKQLALYMPDRVAHDFVKEYMKNNKAIHVSNRIYKPIYDIIQMFSYDFERFAQYYMFAKNQKDLGTVKWILQTSLLKTIAAKLKSTCNKVYKKYNDTIDKNGQQYKIISDTKPNGKVVYFGAHPLKTQYNFSSKRIIDRK